MTTARTSYQQTRMDGLQKGFDVDMAPAQHLTGQALDQWLDAAEDELFAAGLQDLREMKQERERGYRLPPA
jgi:hypothetical protein